MSNDEALTASAQASPALRDPCPDKTRSDLEWNRLLGALSSRCVSAMGKSHAEALPFGRSPREVRALLAEAREASDLLATGEPLPLNGLADVTEALGRVSAAGVLAPQEIRELGRALEGARALRRFLSARRSRVPTLAHACGTDPTLDVLADDLSSLFEPDGTLSDKASPRLRELRGEYQAARTRILARLDDVMARYEAVLQDTFVTEREGRWVIPVRSDAHERFPGIVHATSASGATLFVEPRSVIPMGNRLKVLAAEVEREEQAIYAQVTERVAEVLPSVLGAADALARADVRAATARLGNELGLVFPEVRDEANLDLREARHPLLLLDRLEAAASGRSSPPEVVPSDLSIGARHAMVVSGPNAGGKTVALKAMGLAALMVRAGLPVACDEESTVGIFDLVLTDVGDDQSLTKSLSTFSAHVRNLGHILDETGSGTLVLLDELAGGTDPREGEALAAGMLDALTARGGAVVATTHYEGLKALALADDRFQNASMGFDPDQMIPTFRLAQGVPGSSSALAVARRFGLPATVIERAERFLTREDVQFESVVRKLNDERAALELARANAETREQEAERRARELSSELKALRSREHQVVSKEAESLLAAVRRARDELREVQARLRQKKLDADSAREAERVLARIAARVAVGGDLDPSALAPPGPARSAELDSTALKKGMRVFVPRLRAEAEIVQLLPDGTVRVQAGALKLVLTAQELRQPPKVEEKKDARKKTEGGRAPEGATGAGPASGDPRGLPAALQTSDNTCDLRGLRADDAVAMAVSFLDRALGDHRPVCFLVHGHGTGAIRDALRKELRTSPYVRFFRAGQPAEGGDGVTIAWLT